MNSATVHAITIAPVKGLGLQTRHEVQLGELGVAEDRALYLVDARDRMVNNKRVGPLMAVIPDLDLSADTLSLRFPDGRVLTETLGAGTSAETTFFSRRDTVRRVCPELSAALSDYAGERLELVRADPRHSAKDRGGDGAVSLLSTGSLARLAEAAGKPVDARRFRMLLQVDGLPPHAEDGFVGRDVQIGAACVHFHGHVGRCRVTTLDPDSGEATLATLELLEYRRGLPTTEPLALGIYGAVREPGRVRLGDPVRLLTAARAG
ncbi:MAG TPA: MOSC N-terminal beta barrel domain-containing protein [Solirubrobacteraceae bacterium]|nr:MOSC N-terminal beta barrel domain-containing protein [Solirubrobacteraceae bacterium]